MQEWEDLLTTEMFNEFLLSALLRYTPTSAAHSYQVMNSQHTWF